MEQANHLVTNVNSTVYCGGCEETVRRFKVDSFS